ncbi:MAG: hypothetical protein ACRC01_00430, partial [Deefgea sp.]
DLHLPPTPTPSPTPVSSATPAPTGSPTPTGSSTPTASTTPTGAPTPTVTPLVPTPFPPAGCVIWSSATNYNKGDRVTYYVSPEWEGFQCKNNSATPDCPKTTNPPSSNSAWQPLGNGVCK